MTTVARLAAALVALLCADLCHAQSSPAGADTYPNRPVRMLIPFPPGGVVDVMGRLLAQKLSDQLGQNFYVRTTAAAAAISALRWCRPRHPTAIRC